MTKLKHSIIDSELGTLEFYDDPEDLRMLYYYEDARRELWYSVEERLKINKEVREGQRR